MTSRIHLSLPDITQAEEAAVLKALRSGWIAPLGPAVDAFEEDLARRGGRAHAVALSSGTAALHLGLLALGIGKGDRVLTSTATFAATANAITYTGAEPVFVDSDKTGNISPYLLEEALKVLEKEGTPASAIVPVDLYGKVADHQQIGALAKDCGIPVLSDAAESVGSTRDGRSSMSFGDIAAVSFNGNKIMTTSGGGAILTDDAAIAKRVRHLATQAREPAAYYEHNEIGYNYRLSNLLAALGSAQLERLDSMIERRRQLRINYINFFSDVPGITVFGEPSGAARDTPDTSDNFWLSSILVDSDRAGISAESMRIILAEANIEARPLWKPMHLQPAFKNSIAFVDGTSERLFRKGLSLPSSSVLTAPEIDYIFRTLERAVR